MFVFLHYRLFSTSRRGPGSVLFPEEYATNIRFSRTGIPDSSVPSVAVAVIHVIRWLHTHDLLPQLLQLCCIAAHSQSRLHELLQVCWVAEQTGAAIRSPPAVV